MKHTLFVAAASALALSCTSVHDCDTASMDPTPFEVGATEFPFGDAIHITEVYSSRGTFTPGSELIVRGTYDLRSRRTATLYLGVTATAEIESNGVEPRGNRVTVAEGTGSFDLSFTVRGPGQPHITFYDSVSGVPFGGSYFGAGATLRVDGPLGYDRSQGNAAVQAASED